MSTINFPIMYINNPTQGKPIFNGKMYFGQPDLDPEIFTNQKQVYYIQENGDLVAASQPIALSAGGNPVYNGDAVTLSITGEYSMKVLNKLGAQEFYIARTDSSGDSGSVITYAENEQTLTSGQLVVNFTGITVAVANIYIGKASGDRGKLFEGDDYTVTGGSQITLSSSFSDGTKIIATSSELVVRDSLNQTYDFATRQLMIDSLISFPIGKKLYVKDIKASYIVTNGATTEPQGSPDLSGGGHAKLQIVGCIHNITHYGAIDGADDNTTAMQAAATQAGLLGGVYFEPVGLWIHGQIDMASSTIMMGCGYESRDQRLSDVDNATVTQVGYRFFGEQGIAPYPPEENIKAVTCYQIHFLGTVVDDGFQEFKHLIMMQGATDVDIQTCWFTGWQGDAIVVRSGNATAAAQNRNVKIKDCVFDGVNNNQRNAISITDVYGMTIRDNKFMNCTRNGEFGYVAPAAYDITNSSKGPAMPGAIDIEPNTADTFVILNDIYIGHNTCNNIQGNVAAIGMTMPIATEAFDGEPVRNITVANNILDDVNTGFRFSQVQTATVTNVLRPLNVNLSKNTVTDATDRPFWLFGVRGVKVDGNSFERCANAGAIGFIGVGRNCDQIDMNNNYFRHCGTTDGSALIAYSSSNLDYIGNVFDNCGITGGGFGVLFSFADGASSEIRVERNTLVNNEGVTTGLFSLSGGGSIISGSGNNTYKSNNFLQLDPSAFTADFTDFGESSFETGITATAGTQATATQLTKAMNIVLTASASDAVKLPTATGNARVITVNNRTGVTIKVYPFVGDNLGKGVNISEDILNGESKSYRTYDLNNWIKTTF